MEITDEAIVLSKEKYGESSGIVCLFTSKHGVYKGLVRGISSKKNRGIYQIGNLVEATWRARLAEHLGNISAELFVPSAIHVMDSPTKLAALRSICAVVTSTFHERDPSIEAYNALRLFLSKLTNNSSDWQKHYIITELNILTQTGYGIDLLECVDTGTTENLIYVSPKSGRAVCAASGKPYHDKLLQLPQFLIDEKLSHNENDIKNGIKLSSYFLDKYFFTPHNVTQPEARARFISLLSL